MSTDQLIGHVILIFLSSESDGSEQGTKLYRRYLPNPEQILQRRKARKQLAWKVQPRLRLHRTFPFLPSMVPSTLQEGATDHWTTTVQT